MRLVTRSHTFHRGIACLALMVGIVFLPGKAFGQG